MKKQISKILVKWNMPTRQVAINEIIRAVKDEFLAILPEEIVCAKCGGKLAFHWEITKCEKCGDMEGPLNAEFDNAFVKYLKDKIEKL